MKNAFNPQCITYSQMSLIFNSRMYFRRLAAWTRVYLLSRYLRIGTAEEQFERLYFEALYLGNMLDLIFGRELANRDEQLAAQYAIILRDLISAQLEGNTEEVNRHLAELYQNAADRAAFAAEINPYWNKDELNELLDRYVQYTIEEANALVTGIYEREAEPYRRLMALTEELGDFIAQGLYMYITSGEESTAGTTHECECITFDQLNSIYRIKMFWYELVSIIRNYMISRYMRLGRQAEEFFYDTLFQVALEYATALRKIFGEAVTEEYIRLLYTYFELIDAFLSAQMEGDADEMNRVTRLLYQNAKDRAAFIASINPFLDQAVWERRTYYNINCTINEFTAFIRGDYARKIDLFRTLLDQAESTGDSFVQGLLKYLEKQCRETFI